MDEVVKKRIQELITKHKVFLFMKGNKLMPMCGFSAQVVQILNELKVDFETFNVLQDESIRQGIKDYSNWPTIPQLYINGKFVGGCDITKELYRSGELQKLLE